MSYPLIPEFTQPPVFPEGKDSLVEFLKTHPVFVPHWEEKKGSCPPGNMDLTGGIVCSRDFPDPEQRLETAYKDFERFLTEAGIRLSGKNSLFTEVRRKSQRICCRPHRGTEIEGNL